MPNDPKAVSDFLNKLATDDEFRQSVENDPVKIYAEYGFALDPAEISGEIKLPSKEEITRNLELYRQRGEDIHPMLIFLATGS